MGEQKQRLVVRRIQAVVADAVFESASLSVY